MLIGDFWFSYFVVFSFCVIGNLISYALFRWTLITKINIIITWAILLSSWASLYVGTMVYTGLTGSTTLFGLLVCAAFLVVFLVPLVFYSRHTILEPFRRIENSLKGISKGDLKSKVIINTRDEFGRMGMKINTVISSLIEMITNVKDSSNTSAQLAENLSSSSEEVSASTHEINRNLQSISAQTKELSQIIMIDSVSLSSLKESIEAINDVMGNSKSTIDQTKKMAIDASKYAIDAREKIKVILDSSNETVGTIKTLEVKSGEIPNIVNTINEISEQTNLLALNAAIEAARAGEAGKGFAVVAEEIRKLADQSQKATQQISTIVSDIVENTQMAVDSVEKTGVEVKQGSKTISDALQSLQKIHTQVDNVKSNFSKLDEELNKQKSENENVDSHREDITNFVSKITLSLEKISSSSTDTATAMENISKQSQVLAVNSDSQLKVIDRFNM